MARRKSHDEELPFVALMDTMTNVVGVLVIVLVMIGIGLARTVKKVLSDLPPVTAAEHAKLKQEVEAAKPKHDPKQVEQELEKLKQQLTKSGEELKTLDVTKDEQKIKITDLDDLKKQITEKQKVRDAKKAEVDKLLAEVDRMKALLDTTPVPAPPPELPPSFVKLPNPRPMPANADIQHFLVTGGRIIFIADDDIAKLIEQELKNNEQALALIREVVKGADGRPVMIKDKSGHLTQQRKVVYDSKKTAAHFARTRLNVRGYKIEIPLAANSPRIPVRVTPTADAGETVEQARRLTSSFQQQLRAMKANPKAVAWFHVYKDSIQTYLDARDIADQSGMPAGWEIYGNQFFVFYLPPQFIVDYQPPPPLPPAPPGAVPAVVIAPPKQTLD